MNFTKKLLFIAIMGFLFISCKEVGKENTETGLITIDPVTTVSTGKTETTTFTIEGMSCAVMCAAKIEKELSILEGVQMAKVDFDTKTATVTYTTSKQSPKKLAKIVEDIAGGEIYKVSNIKKVDNPE